MCKSAIDFFQLVLIGSGAGLLFMTFAFMVAVAVVEIWKRRAKGGGQ